ncbi:MAG: PAS-domain containing protein [Rhodospirillaceae bacterium]|nr:PAS-domain containing protein [Rhodospirillaceae bacterium]
MTAVADTESLEARLQMLEHAVAHMDQGLLVLDRERRVVFWNKRYEYLWDFPPGFVAVGKPLADIVRFDIARRNLPPGEAEMLLQQRLARSIAPGAPGEVPLPHLDRILRIDLLQLPEGGSVVTFTDVTAARRQAEAFAASEARFAIFVGMSADWIWEQDSDLRFTFVSRPKDVELDVFPGDNVGKRRDELDLIVTDEEAWRQHLEDIEAHRPFRNLTYARCDHDGTVHHIRISGDPIFGADGAFLGYRGTGTDVTAEIHALERAKSAEVKAENAHARLITALETITQGFALFDAEDRLVMCNRQYLDKTAAADIGWAIGKRFEDLVRANLASGWRGHLPGSDTEVGSDEWIAWRLAMHRDPPPRPYIYKGSDDRWLMISEKRTAEGGTVAIRVDVTDLKKAEEDLRVARDQAEAAGRAKNEFLASMSHELRTPLNAIMGFAEILKGEMFGPIGVPRYRNYADDIHASATYLMELVRDVLDMSRIEAGRMDLTIESIDVTPEIGRCLGMVGGSARSAGLAVRTEIVEPAPVIRADSRAFRQILLNLLSNSVKFTPSGGQVTVTVALDGSRARIVVADTGVGIPAWALPRLGRPFEQVDNVLQRKKPGSGLGLALSRSLAELMGGTIVIESSEGKGTRVTLSLPLARATE